MQEHPDLAEALNAYLDRTCVEVPIAGDFPEDVETPRSRRGV